MISTARSKQVIAKLRAKKRTGTAENSLVPLSRISTRLTATIAHDLRSPITVIRGYLKMLLSGRIGPMTPEQQECLEGAMTGVNQLSRIAGMVGEVSGLTEQSHPEILNFHELWLKAWESIRPQAKEKGVILKERFTAERPMVCGDRRILTEIILELIVVALASYGKELLVELSSLKSGDIVLRMAFDCGSPEPDLEAVVSGLLSKVFFHGGKLTFNASRENGSSFTLLMPGCEV